MNILILVDCLKNGRFGQDFALISRKVYCYGMHMALFVITFPKGVILNAWVQHSLRVVSILTTERN